MNSPNLHQWHCEVEGCTNPKGKYTLLCPKHYSQQWHRTRTEKPCSMPNCPNPARARGLCGTHAHRLRVNGDPNVVQRRQKETKSYIKDGIGYIELTQGYFAKIDVKNFEYLNQYKWQVLRTPDKKLYATRR